MLTRILLKGLRSEFRPPRLQLWSNIHRKLNSTIRTTSTVSFSFILRNGDEQQVHAEIGKHLLDVAHDNSIELEGACGGELACATCHLVFDPEIYKTLPVKQEEEDDMLDLAFGLTDTSRLGCQIRVCEAFEGMKVLIPDDGFP